MARLVRSVLAYSACLLGTLACGRSTREVHAGDAGPGGQSGSGSTPVSGASGTTVGGRGGGGGEGLSGSSGSSSDGGIAFKLSDETVGYLERFEVVSDRAGNALVIWSAGTTIHARRWDEGRGQFVDVPDLVGEDSFLVASPAGEFPLIAWGTPLVDDPELYELSANRFDFDGNTWGRPSPVPGLSYGLDMVPAVVDSSGNAHIGWRNPDGAYASYWPEGATDWGPALDFYEDGELVAGTASTFRWSERDAILIQSFDASTQGWSDAVELRDLTINRVPTSLVFLTGRDDTTLLVSNRRDPDALVVEAWRRDPVRDAWGAAETVTVIPMTSDPDRLTGRFAGVTDPLGDLVFVPHEAIDGTIDFSIEHYDPVAGAWSTSRSLDGQSSNGSIVLVLDDFGRAYGYVLGTGLLRFDPETRTWADGPDAGLEVVLASEGGAFAFGGDSTRTTQVLKSDAGGDWRPVIGMPANARLDPFHPVAVGIVGREKALVAWSGSSDGETGVWASFVE